MNTQPQQVNRVTVFLTRSPGGIPSPNHKVVLRDLSSFQCMALLSGLFFKLYWEIKVNICEINLGVKTNAYIALKEFFF